MEKLKSTRENRIGLIYAIEGDDKETTITCESKPSKPSIVIKVSVIGVFQMWYNWIRRNQFIQDAFSVLTDDEREFLMTGTTPKEWAEMFPPEEEEQ